MAEGPLHVVATAGHVDHGKSSLIVRLTGIDPDRWDEEKRRGLTIDLGFAWCTLPSGREIGFVDVPGHERFVRNMLAGVGPVRLVLLVVAADEGWKPQSEEHLSIVDVLGAERGVVALTKRDLVDDALLARRTDEVRERLAGTVLADAPIVACSARTDEGLDDLRAALDDMVAAAPPPEDRDRPRIHIDRSFTIRGAGTVITGTLTDGSLAPGDEVVVHPTGLRARIRSLQTHRRPVDVARPVSRVAANLASTTKEEVERGDVLTRPGQWRATSLLEARVSPVRGLDHRLTERGAYKLYAGSAERDARLRFYGEDGLARVKLSRPIVVDVGDRFVIREAGRRETVGGGVVLDIDPPARPGSDVEARLTRRERAGRADLPSLIVAEQGAVRAADLSVLAGDAAAQPSGARRIGPWWLAEARLAGLREAAVGTLEAFHRDRPLQAGIDAADLRQALEDAAPDLTAQLEQGLGAEVLGALEHEGVTAREGNTVRLASHSVRLGDREGDAIRLVAAVAAGEPTPPSVKDLVAEGFDHELIEACVAIGRLVGVSPELVATPSFVSGAEELATTEAARPEGLTVSRFRELLGTTRKYALPILESFDRRGLTRRDGDVRRVVDSER